MPPPRAHTVNGGLAALPSHSSLQYDDDDDLDDICPVCESECTCRKKSAPSPAPLPSASSTPSSAPSVTQSSAAGKRPLKIKLTLPPNLKARNPPTTHASSTSSAHLGSAAQDAGPSSRPAPSVRAAAPAPKRRGRPPKALAAKYNTKKKPAADDMEYKARGTTGSAAVRKVHQPVPATASLSVSDLSDSTLSDYPTFLPAVDSSTHSDSSQSSDSSINSDSDDEPPRVVRNDDARHVNSTKLLPSHVGHVTKRVNNRWENKQRKTSVGAGEEEEEESSDTNESSDASSEDGDDEDDGEDDTEADVEADVEAGGSLAGADVDLDEEETHSRIGVSFPGTGWSEDDEDESFDADLFFANLDSDSAGSSPEVNYSSLHAFMDEDVELAGSFSADEEDALLLMDLEPSAQLRRENGEFEIGVDLDNLSFGWDGQLFANGGAHDGLGLSFGVQAIDEDEEMGSMSVLQESDGDTTEDELVDSDGLPNPRAMMLFKWPSTISAINPLSTLSPSSIREPPVNASPSTRIALASISSQCRSPPPTPSPADILAGRVSMDDLEDIEMEKLEKERQVRRRRGSAVPVMGEFVVGDVHAGLRTAIVGTGAEVPSFYPRSVRIYNASESPMQDFILSEDVSMAFVCPPLTTESSEDTQELSQLSYASDVSSTDVIELDDVLDSSLLDSEPPTEGFETDVPGSMSESSPIKPGTSPHLHNLSRWERIPMTTFRRTRETATASGVDGAVSDSGMSGLQYHRNVGAMIGGMPLYTPPRPLGLDKMSRASARKRKGRHSHGSSPTLLPARDGVLGSPFTPAGSAGSSLNGHSNKSKKEIKKEKAMMKRKMVAKSSQYRYNQPHRAHHHSHHPNHKSRAANAVQRAGFSSGASSSIPSLSI
ncbi:hypothetical protein C8Q80DRAFT_1273900 [Daedaleopsis nitida]|nr:hypothetical protein C8Q80DRAFT_1273900 [Daedaleopsis nitida]